MTKNDSQEKKTKIHICITYLFDLTKELANEACPIMPTQRYLSFYIDYISDLYYMRNDHLEFNSLLQQYAPSECSSDDYT